ncbi:HAUS augmin-like complex subunit 3 [Eublepharis macularius]|uniref:HAUS augmin-like complex subunit 3 n=1 Tax=Eublepharis macularius TaxID=481883 RepID=A0AA97JL26_EUBMA|nr:HAUS augmin-like complex subunit 3 [Eublepharis macularius]XP_054840292.1 HAUS augmin-like complex subunit 3 [Eublepharis macularius]XP_054840293.1 HAUS augmin-like complex subunit 3 [Eublepharis macularius]
MNCGTQFVETLKRISYPETAALNGEDFDWLFETLEDKSFLEWFCTNVNEYHALSEEELQLFHNLLNSAKPVLEEEALGEVLKTCKPLDLNSSNLEEENLKALEDELQALQKMKNLKIRHRNKLQAMTSISSLRSLKLKEMVEETAKSLKDVQAMFAVMNTKINNELKSLIERVQKLTSFFIVQCNQKGLEPQSVLLAQLALDDYLGQEEQSTAALTLYTKKQFFQGISKLVESSNEEKFQLVDIRSSFTDSESSNVCEEPLELTRLQTAYVCAQHQLIQQKARDLSMRSGLQWAEDNISSLKKVMPGKENFEARISSLNNEISKIKTHLAQINSETLPLLIKEDAELLNMPVVKGDFDLQIARQDYYTSRQDQICNQLLKQKAAFELLQLAYEIELRKLRDNSRLLEKITQVLKQSSNGLEQTLEAMSEPSISQYKIPRSTIDSRDNAAHRLYQLLEGKDTKQLFRTNEGLEQVAEKLRLETAFVLDQLAVLSQEQTLLLSKMDADLDALHETMYFRGDGVSLSNSELIEQFHQLEFQLNKLNQLIMDFLADIKAKKKVLDNNKLQQIERKLYVYFFKNKECLKNVVERMEQQAKAQAFDYN